MHQKLLVVPAQKLSVIHTSSTEHYLLIHQTFPFDNHDISLCFIIYSIDLEVVEVAFSSIEFGREEALHEFRVAN